MRHLRAARFPDRVRATIGYDAAAHRRSIADVGRVNIVTITVTLRFLTVTDCFMFNPFGVTVYDPRYPTFHVGLLC